MRVRKEDVAPLMQTPATYRRRLAAQHRFAPDVGARLLEPTWGFGKYKISNWQEALNCPLTTWYITHKANLGSERLLELLEFCVAERERAAAGAAAGAQDTAVEASVEAHRADVLEVLRQSRDQGSDERRKVFKGLLLKWHPDKNPDGVEEAAVIFQYIVKQRSWFL